MTLSPIFRMWVGFMAILVSDLTTTIGVVGCLAGATLIGHTFAELVWGERL